MITVRLEGLDKLRAGLAAQQKQARFAAAVALTRTAKAAQEKTATKMRDVFDRPTRWTMNSLWIKPATRDTLAAMLYLKDRDQGGKATGTAASLIGHHWSGGVRQRKKLETWMTRAGLISSTEMIVPGAGARLDAYGNISRGQLSQMMSQLRLGIDTYSWSSTSARSRRNVKKAGRIFWSRGPQGGQFRPRWGRTGPQRLAKGAWIDAGEAVGVRPLLVVISRASYRRRIDMERIVRDTVRARFGAEFDRAYADALRTAR